MLVGLGAGAPPLRHSGGIPAVVLGLGAAREPNAAGPLRPLGQRGGNL